MLAAQIHFAEKVGTAPSTTTMVLRGDGQMGIACYPVPSVAERNAWIARGGAALTPGDATPMVAPVKVAAAAKAVANVMNPYASEVEMRGLAGIGLVDPNDAWYTGDVARVRAHGTTTILFNPLPGGGYSSTLLGGGLGITNGEINRSLTGGLGTVPNDDELARNLCYTPVHSGWIYGQTPTGQNHYVDGFYGADGVPVYKKAGFWLAVGGTALAIGGTAYALTRGKKRRRGARRRRR